MSFNTEKFGLVALQRGDVMSVIAEKNNMSIIDSHLAFLLNIQDNFIFNGWELSLASSDIIIGNKIIISEGSGFIDKNFVRSFGSIQYTLNEIGDYFVYIQKKSQYTAFFSKTSNVYSIVCSGLNTPLSVSGFSVNSISKDSIGLIWDFNGEPDIQYYQISRSTDDLVYEEISTVNSNQYLDFGLSQNTIYYYKIIAKNKSGQYSPSSSLSITTSLDLSSPKQINGLIVSSGDSEIFLTWKQSQDQISGYLVEIFSMSADRLTETLIDSSTVLTNSKLFSGLANNILYKVYIYTISINLVQSEGVNTFVNIYQTKFPPIVQNLTISQSQNINSTNVIDLNISFEQNVIIGRTQASKFSIFIQQNYGSWSDQISVNKDISLLNSIVISSYYQSGLKKTITSRKSYLIKIVPVNSDNKNGTQIISYILTQNFVNPHSVSSINFTQIDNDLIVTWENSKSSFVSNIFSLKVINIQDNSYIQLQNEVDLKQANSYIINNFKQYFSKKIEVTIYVVDDFSLSSEALTNSIIIEDIDLLQVPSGVIRTSISTGYGDVYLSWQSVSELDKYYYIWRIVDNGNLASVQIQDYQLVDTILFPTTQYVDYTTQLGVKYFYFITVQDIFGRKQLGPQDNINSYSHLHGYVRGSPMIPPNITSIEQSNYDATINWSYDIDNFDGFEIYRSQNDKISWQKIGSTDKNSSSFIDINGLTKNDTNFYYFVRKFRNQIKFNIVRDQNYIPQSSIYYMKANYDGFNIVYDLKFSKFNNLSDFIQNTVKTQVANHNHTKDDVYDKRIDLGNNVIIRNFISNDNLVFTTQEKIDTATKYVVLVDFVNYTGKYSLNISQKTITFNQSILGTVQIQCIGVNQTYDLVRYRTINKYVADILTSGKLSNRQIQFRHNIKQELSPVKFLGQTENGFEFFYTRQSQIGQIGNSTSFYDFIKSGSYIYSATSNGVMYSPDDGSTWSSVLRTSSPCHSLFVNSNGNLFALCSQSVYISQNNQEWSKCIGTQDASAIRDICQDNLGNIYVSSDLGVFILQSGFGFISPKIVLTNSTDFNITDSFGIYFDSTLSSIKVSTSKGLMQTFDQGNSWSSSSEFNYLDIIYQFQMNLSCIFGLSDNKVYRKKTGDFQIISDVSEYSRRIYYFQNSLYILSDGKVFKTNDSIDINNDTAFKVDVPINISCDVANVDITGFNILSGQMLIGGDCVFNRFDQYGGQLQNIYQNFVTTIPSFYINSKRIKTSAYYNSDQNSVWFDTIVSVQNKVGIVVDYTIYHINNGGWIDLGYSANVSVSKNNNNIFQYSGVSSNGILNLLKNVDFSSITQNNSNLQLSNKYITKYNDNNSKLQNIFSGVETLKNNQTRQSIVFDSFTYYRMSFARNKNNIKFFSIQNILQKQYTVVSGFALTQDNFDKFNIQDLVPYIPQISIPPSQYVFVNSSSGIIKMLQSAGKYDLISIEINFGSSSNNRSHSQIQDGIELVNSGLQFGISDVFNKNIVSMSNFIQRQWTGQIDGTVDIYGYKPFSKYNMINIIPQNDQQFNKIDSSAFYENKVNYTSFGFTMQYISYANYLPWIGSVLIGGLEGLVSIDKTTINFSPVYNDICRNFINTKDIYTNDQIVYIVSQNNIYLSSDLIQWQRYNSFGCNGNFIKFFSNNGIQYIITDIGIYFKIKSQMSFTLSKSITRFDAYTCNSYIVLVDNGIIFYSVDGITWKQTTQQSFDINDLIQYRNQISVASSKGLKFDFGSIINGNPQFGLILTQGTTSLSQAVVINTINISDDKQFIFAGSNSGNVYKIQGQNLISKTQTNLQTIKFVFLIDNKIWAVSNNSIYMQDIGNPIKISTGIPF